MKKINQCTLTLTRKCNLRCNFCYAKETGYIPDEYIKYENAKKIVDICDDSKVKYIVLTGGEPTLYPNIVELIQYIKSRKNTIVATIATNGITLSNEQYCNSLIQSGLDYVDISLKGKNPLSFKLATGCNDFDLQMKGIQNIAKTGIDFTCSMVITQDNVLDYCDTIQIAYNNGARKFSFTFVIDNEDCILKKDQYLSANNPFKLIESFISQIDKLNSITNGEWWIEYSYPLCFYTEEQLSILSGRLAEPCQIYYQNGITFDAKMNLIPCSMNINTIIGTYESDFSNKKELDLFINKEKYKSIIDDLNKSPSQKCKECKHYKHCLGGCPLIWKHFSFKDVELFKTSYYEKE